MTNESFLSRLLVLLVHSLSAVMPGHSRPKGRRALHAYVPGIHVLRLPSAGMTTRYLKAAGQCVRELRNATDPGIVSWIRKSLLSALAPSA
jgi:hypothetical protein